MNRGGATGSIILGNPQGGSLAVGGAILVLALLLWATIRSTRPPREKWSLFGLKALALTLLVFCLFDPQILRPHVRSGENLVLLLADESASMRIRQSPKTRQTRGDWAKQIFDANAPWIERFAEEFAVRRYRFGDRLTRTESFTDLEFQSPASRLQQALHELQARFHNQPLAAILLISDGNSTDGLPPDLEKLGVPVFPIVENSSADLDDLGLGRISVSQTHFEDTPITVQAAITFTGERPAQVHVSLSLKDADETISPLSQLLNVPGQGEVIARFQFKPPRPGTLFYQLSVHRADEPDPFSPAAHSREATLANNQRWLVVNRDSHPARLLYVGGRPNWDYKFLNRALADDPLLQLTSLIRIARKEARFDFRGRIGESSNSLFRGFKSDADEETEDYSQPVLIRLNLRDAGELSDGFPKEKAALYRYDAVILDDVEATFFSHDQQSLLDRFVSERGGGLLMLGGINSFRNGKWERTPVADALPVYLNRPGPKPGKELTWQLSQEGFLEPWLRLRETEQAEQERMRQMPLLSIINPVTQPKPGARWLAHVLDESGRQSPAIVTQQYGQGRTAAVLLGDLWKWSLRPPAETPDDAAKSWRQMMRWLVGDVPQRMAVSIRSADPASGPEFASGLDPASGPEITSGADTVIQTRLRTEEFQPDDDQHVTVRVRQPDGSEVNLNAPPDLQEAGLYEAHSLSRTAGTYLATVSLSGDTGEQRPPREIGWVSDPEFEEFQTTQVNRAALEELARRTGGELVSASRLDSFAASFPHRRLPVSEMQSVPLWQTPWMILGVLGLLAAEWGIRRWKGLP